MKTCAYVRVYVVHSVNDRVDIAATAVAVARKYTNTSSWYDILSRELRGQSLLIDKFYMSSTRIQYSERVRYPMVLLLYVVPELCENTEKARCGSHKKKTPPYIAIYTGMTPWLAKPSSY